MLLCVGFSFSQTKNDTVKSISELSDLVISTKLPTDYSKLANQVVAISAKQIDFCFSLDGNRNRGGLSG